MEDLILDVEMNPEFQETLLPNQMGVLEEIKNQAFHLNYFNYKRDKEMKERILRAAG
jgi:hypothetical protein